jgi:hypothetical protein
MDRVVRFKVEDLDRSLRLSPEDRLRQANAAFRLYHAIHRPYAKPWLRGVDRVEDLDRIEEEISRRS